MKTVAAMTIKTTAVMNLEMKSVSGDEGFLSDEVEMLGGGGGFAK